jgi:mannose-1-phosphate guanylyltransferase
MNTHSAQVVILAGGQGSRFWPMSRRSRPKQFLSISADGESLIQATARRVAPLTEPFGLWVATNAMQRSLTEEHVPQARIICEPFGRDTAASIGLAAIHVRKHSPDAVMVVLAADHAVEDEAVLVATLQRAVHLAREKPVLVTIGIAPTHPHTGYGYIRRGSPLGEGEYLVSRFFEKPNFERAKGYYESGEFYWNSGMFVWHVDTILQAIRQHLPELYEGLLTIEAAIGTDREARVTEEIFKGIEPISIDFGVLEHARNCAVIVGPPFGWNDVGTWDAWAGHFQADEQGNMVSGDTLLLDSTGCVVCSSHRFTAVLGGEDLIVIDSGDALLVCPRDRVQDVREIVKELGKRNRTELI